MPGRPCSCSVAGGAQLCVTGALRRCDGAVRTPEFFTELWLMVSMNCSLPPPFLSADCEPGPDSTGAPGWGSDPLCPRWTRACTCLCLGGAYQGRHLGGGRRGL